MRSERRRRRSDLSVERVERMGKASAKESEARSRDSGLDVGVDAGVGSGFGAGVGWERTGLEALNGLNEYGSKGSSAAVGMPDLEEEVL